VPLLSKVIKPTNKMKKLVFIFLLVSASIITYGQLLSWQIAVGDRSATIIPSTHLFDNKFYPVIQTGVEYTYLEKPRFSLGQTAKFHYSYHPVLGNDFGVISEAAAKYKVKEIFFIGLNLGLGYFGELPATKTFKRNEKGEYEETHPLLSMVAIPFSVMVGHEFKNGISPFLSYQYCVQLPYNRTIAALPSDNLLVGVKVKFQKKGKR
jgi:hypothetical protein